MRIASLLQDGKGFFLCHREQANIIYISQAALVEVVAAICRKAREQNITDSERDELINTFARQDSQHAYIIFWPVTTPLYRRR